MKIVDVKTGKGWLSKDFCKCASVLLDGIESEDSSNPDAASKEDSNHNVRGKQKCEPRIAFMLAYCLVVGFMVLIETAPTLNKIQDCWS